MKPVRGWSDRIFIGCLILVGAAFALLIIGMLAADLLFIEWRNFLELYEKPEIRYATKLTLLSCLTATILSLWVAVPFGYVLSRQNFPGKALLDIIVDIPLVLPPLVLGLSLLILFQTQVGRAIEQTLERHTGWMLVYLAIPVIGSILFWPLLSGKRALLLVATLFFVIEAVMIGWVGPQLKLYLNNAFGTRVTYGIPAVILAQFAVAGSFSIRTMKVTFDQLSPRTENVALTLGCTRAQAFWLVVVPEARRGIVSAAGVAFARSLGEFGPILVFAGTTRMKTEVLSSTVFLELSVGRLNNALTVSMVLVGLAFMILGLMRMFGLRNKPL